MRIGKTKIDKSLAAGGSWVDADMIDPTTGKAESCSFLLASADANLNPGYQSATLRASKTFRAALQAYGDDPASMPQGVREQMTASSLETFAKTVLLDWKGFQDDDGKPLRYTSQLGIQLLNEFPELYQNLRARAENTERFRREQDAADVGNLRIASSTASA